MSLLQLRPDMGEPQGIAPELAQAGPQRYLLVSPDEAHGAWLGRVLLSLGRVLPAVVDAQALESQIARHGPHAVFLDFGALDASESLSAVPRALAQQWPGVPVIGLGRAADPASMLAALRAGVHDFIDMGGTEGDAIRTVTAVLERRSAAEPAERGRIVALLGARAGLGVTTLAASLALMLQRQPAQEKTGPAPAASSGRDGALLLDLGLPARDGLLYLDVENSFSFVDGVRHLRRLDRTLVQSAFARHGGGAAVLPLPTALAQMREVSHAESVALVRRLSELFNFQVLDLGGFAPVEFAAQAVQAADRVFVVCDQSIGGVVSTAALLRDLEARGVPAQQVALVVNQFDARAGLPATDIADRLGLQLAHVLPARRAALLDAASRGKMLVAEANKDPYTLAVLNLARMVRGGATGAAVAPAMRLDAVWQNFKARLARRGMAP